jgi:hypothetical protein
VHAFELDMKGKKRKLGFYYSFNLVPHFDECSLSVYYSFLKWGKSIANNKRASTT